MDLCINESHLCPLETFDPKVEDFLYSTDMVTYLDDHLQPNELPLDNKESTPAPECTTRILGNSSTVNISSFENEKRKADSSNKQMNEVMSASFFASMIQK